MTSSVGQTLADVRLLKDDAEQAQPGVEFSVVEEITINFPIALLDANVLYPNIIYENIHRSICSQLARIIPMAPGSDGLLDQ
ncbi:hypothetical protein NLL50_05180 [Corynebacterium propinquum]|uniref:hypothetical protein n=1 Tax=Corynebacterium propinquum TaxID=43769 RepID=UPI002670B4CE|nr:hypothetical protein [Corynebacterium propinquum]WKS35123.1 hypothetical protein NLL50_05180 [Corynebacterium propinquum]WKS41603.1 hypothetical protein NLL41_05190 [Corynebacterium propinquum]